MMIFISIIVTLIIVIFTFIYKYSLGNLKVLLSLLHIRFINPPGHQTVIDSPKDLPVNTEKVDDDNKFEYDTHTFTCLSTSGADLEFIQTSISRLEGRRALAKLTVKSKHYGVLTLPSNGCIIPNVNSHRFSVAGLMFYELETERRWKIVYRGELLQESTGEYLNVNLILLWSNLADFKQVVPSIQAVCSLADNSQIIQSGHSTYLQCGCLHGDVKLGDKTEEVVLRGVRTREQGCEKLDQLEDGFTILKLSKRGHISYHHHHIYDGILDISKYQTWSLWPNMEEKSKEYSLHLIRVAKQVLTTVKKNKIYYAVKDEPSTGGTEFCVHFLNSRGPTDTLSNQPLSVPYLTNTGVVSSQNKLVVDLTDGLCRNNCLVGGKGSQLAILHQHMKTDGRYEVPDGICLTVLAFQQHINSVPGLIKAAQKLEQPDINLHELETLCSEVRSIIIKAPVSDELSNLIFTSLIGKYNASSSNLLFAVRSSAIGEDSEELSAAGQLDTILGVKLNKIDIIQAVKQCWSSHYNFAAIQYRCQHGQPVHSGMGVVIQELVEPEIAGVLFTVDPVTADHSMMMINANYGLGEAVVSGETDPDTIKIKRRVKSDLQTEFTITEQITGSKLKQHKISEDGDLVVVSNTNSTLCINEQTTLNLCRIGLELEKGFGCACDIEWAVRSDQIYLLQSRPVTTLNSETEFELIHEFDSANVRDDELISTMNIGEVLPGACSPLFMSSTGLMLDVNVAALSEWNKSNFNRLNKTQQFIKYFNSQIFLDIHMLEISNERRGFLLSRKMLELNLAGHTLQQMTDDEVNSFHPDNPTWKKLQVTFQVLLNLWNSVTHMDKYRLLLDQVQVNTETTDCNDLYKNINTVLQLFDPIGHLYMTICSTPSSYYLSAMSILSQGAEWTQQHYSDLATLLGCKTEDVLTSGIPDQLSELAEMIRISEKINKNSDFHELDVSTALQALQSGADRDVTLKYNEFLQMFGHRGFRELELMEKGWKHDQKSLVKILQLMSATASSSTSSAPTAQEALSKRKSPVTGFKLRILSWLLKKMKRGVALREESKNSLVKSTYDIKVGYWRLGELLHQQGFIPDRQLIFFITHIEIKQLLETRSGQLVARAQKRRKVFEKLKEMKFERFNNGIPKPIGQINLSNIKSDVTLNGMPVSVGQVTASVRVVHQLSDAHNIQRGEILIVPYTDIGWAPYFPLISGIVTEQGGLISHGAVVAREYGLPALASCLNATSIFNTGDRAVLNGTEGFIKRIVN